MLAPLKRNKGVSEVVFFIRLMIGTRGFLPYIIIDLGEKAVGIKLLMNYGEIDAVGEVHGLLIYFGPPNNKHLLLIRT